MDSKSGFTKLVQKLAPEDLKNTEYLQEAIDFILEYEPVISSPRSYVPKTLDVARRFEAWDKSNGLKDNEEHSNDNPHRITYSDLLLSDNLLNKLKSWVEEVRRELFQSTSPPFKNDIRGAAKWIKEEEVEAEGKRHLPSKEAYETIIRLSKEHNIPISLRNDTLSYIDGESNYVTRVSALPNTKLYRLAKEVNRTSEATGFLAASLTVYLLTGIEPILPRKRVTTKVKSTKLTNDELINRTQLSIEVNVTDLTFDELKNLYDQYRSSLNVKRTTPISDEQIEFYYLVTESEGPISGKGSTEFWRKIQDTWNARHPDKQLSSDKAARMKYKRTAEKISRINSQE